MYCKKCGTEQKDGQKFCPKCGTPYLNVEQNDINSLKKDVKEEIEIPQIELSIDSEKEQVNEYKENNSTSDTQPLSENEERKVRRIAKAGMWIITIAIVLTFVNAGFGFSFWWYLYLIIMAIIAFLLFVMSSTNDSDKRKLNTNDSYLTNLISWIGAIMLAILYLWGPLNNDYELSRDDSDSYKYERSSSSDSSDKTPSWIQGTWYCVTPYGNMQVEIVGDHIREIPGDGSSYYGTYHIQGDAIMPETGSQMYYQMDFDKKRLSAGQGYYFRKQ